MGGTRGKVLAMAMLLGLTAFMAGCHYTSDRYRYSRSDAYREGYRDGREYERGTYDDRYRDYRYRW